MVQIRDQVQPQKDTTHKLDETERTTDLHGLSSESPGVTSEMLCPITHAIFEDPVTILDGNSYERSALKRAWETRGGRPYSPLTGEKLSTNLMIPNHTMRKMIQGLIHKHKVRIAKQRQRRNTYGVRQMEAARKKKYM